MKNRFDIIFEETMRSLITEAWDRYSLEEIAAATAEATHNFTDEWNKGTTGQLVTQAISKYCHYRASDFIGGKIADDVLPNAASILEKCMGYWTAKSQGSGSQFDAKCLYSFKEWKLAHSGGASYEVGSRAYIPVVEIGLPAWAIWKAMSSMQKKAETNTEKANSMNFESMFKAGDQIEVELAITTCYQKNSDFGSAWHMKGKDPRWPDISFDVVEGKKIRNQFFSDFPGCPDDRRLSIIDNALPGDVIKVTGKVKSMYKQNLTVYLNYATVTGVTSFAKNPETVRREKLTQLVKEMRDRLLTPIKDHMLKTLKPTDQTVLDLIDTATYQDKYLDGELEAIFEGRFFDMGHLTQGFVMLLDSDCNGKQPRTV